MSELSTKGEVRARVVAMKDRNGSGAKVGRKVKAKWKDKLKKNQWQWMLTILIVREKPAPSGGGWNGRSGQIACWKPW